ncbi:MAG: transcriptional repressor LexA [Patescibacteria group bacterium]
MEKKPVGAGKPSKRQAEILQFVTKFQREKSYSPSLGEIADNFGVSIPTIHQHISYLRKKNLLSADKGKRRSIQAFNDQKRDLVEIPLMGLIAAGGPIEAIRNPEPIEVPRSMLSRGANYYALKVSGTSMIEEGISDGDIVIVREQQAVNDGEKAVAYLPDKNAVTLKKIYREKRRIKLVPANKYMKPFYEKNVEIQGRVVGVLRREF